MFQYAMFVFGFGFVMRMFDVKELQLVLYKGLNVIFDVAGVGVIVGSVDVIGIRIWHVGVGVGLVWRDEMNEFSSVYFL